MSWASLNSHLEYAQRMAEEAGLTQRDKEHWAFVSGVLAQRALEFENRLNELKQTIDELKVVRRDENA